MMGIISGIRGNACGGWDWPPVTRWERVKKSMCGDARVAALLARWEKSAQRGEPLSAEELCCDCPELEKEPARRYQTADALADDLRSFLAGGGITARSVGRLGRIWRWYRANSSAAVATAGGYSVLSGCVLLCWGMIGLAYYNLGVQLSGNPARAVLELLILCLVVYPLFISAGVATLNGRVFALWLSAIWWFAWSHGCLTQQCEVLSNTSGEVDLHLRSSPHNLSKIISRAPRRVLLFRVSEGAKGR